MKKIVSTFLLMFFCAASTSAQDFFLSGVKYFKSGKYYAAIKDFKKVIKKDPLNVNARYYLSQIYLIQKRTSEAQQQYQKIIFIAPDSDAAKLSQYGLDLISQAKGSVGVSSSIQVPVGESLEAYSDNYLGYVIPDGDKVKRWANFPIKVYIESKKAKEVCKKAFLEWQKKTNNTVSFEFVPTSQDAQIIVNFNDKLESSSTKESYIAGLSRPYYQDGNIIRSEVKILTIDPTSKKPLADDFIYFTMLHEIGHSLGIKGHSPDEKDIMFARSEVPKLELTSRDINSVTLLYKADNETLANIRDAGSSDKLKQAIGYAKASPDKAFGWANLGDIYRGKKMYSKAIENYQKAVSIEPKNSEFYSLLANSYEQSGDLESAFLNYQKSCELNKSNVLVLYSFAKFCADNNKKQEALPYIQEFLKKNPKANSDKRIQALKEIYL